MLFLMQPRIWLAFWAVSTHFWVMLSFSSTSTPKSFSSELLSILSPPSLYLCFISYASIQLIHVLIHYFLICQIFILVWLQIVQENKYSTVVKGVLLSALLKMECTYFLPCNECSTVFLQLCNKWSIWSFLAFCLKCTLKMHIILFTINKYTTILENHT